MNDFNSKKINEHVILKYVKSLPGYFSILFLSFVFFYWIIPFFSHITLGEDYSRFSMGEQLELLFSLKTGSVPLFIPGFAGGQSSAALTLGQFFHPISHIASILPGYWNGKALEWNTFLRLLSLGLAQVFIFMFLRKIGINKYFSFIISTVTVYHLRMLDIFRYGAALEAWTGHLFLCMAIGWYCLKPTRWQGPLSIIASTYWLVCSGHPQMMYYGLFGAGLFTLIIPFFLNQIAVEKQNPIKSIPGFWMQTCVWIGMGVLLSFAYILPFYFDFLSENVERVTRDYNWANLYVDTFIGTLNNFFFPLRADVHGAFGGSPLFLICFLLPITRLFRIKIPGIIWIIWTILLLSFLHMQGHRLPVHYLVWKYLPLASSFRVAGRITMIMPVFFMLLLCWILHPRNLYPDNPEKNIKQLTPVILSATALICLIIYFFLPDTITSDSTLFSPVSIREIPSWTETVLFSLGIATLAVLLLYYYLKNRQLIIGPVLCIITCIQILCLLPYGTWIKEKKNTPTFEQLADQKRKNLGYDTDLPGAGMNMDITLHQAEKSFIEPFLGKIYRNIKSVHNNKDVYNLMAESHSPDKAIIEGNSSILPFSVSDSSTEEAKDQVNLVFSSFNKLIFQVNTKKPAFFALAYPFSTKWLAFINGERTQIYRANGSSHAVMIPAGKSKVEFRYWSLSACIGIFLSCMTFLAAGIYFSFMFSQKKIRTIMAVGAVFISISGIYVWKNSIYNGSNLNTKYTWISPPASSYSNIAYGKRTASSSYTYPGYPYMFRSGMAVDGNRNIESGFITQKEKNPYWMMDLHHPQQVGSILVYESRNGLEMNTRPITVSFSNDKKNWESLSLTSKKLSIQLTEPVITRYILFTASGICNLSFDEVEIYPKKIEDMATMYFDENKFYEAIFFYTKLLEMNKENPEIYYQLASIYSRQNKVKEAIILLKIALEKGYHDLEHIKTDINLKNIHKNDDFIRLLTQNRSKD
jgi:hypothetical protein